MLTDVIPQRHSVAAIVDARDFSSVGACLTSDFFKLAHICNVQCGFHLGSASVVPPVCEANSVAPIMHWGQMGLMRLPSVLVLTGRGSFRPIQSSLTKATLSRPIMPKVLPPQATGHLASKFL